MFERTIAEKSKLRRGKIAEIEGKEKKQTINFLRNILLIVKVQVICIKITRDRRNRK